MTERPVHEEVGLLFVFESGTKSEMSVVLSDGKKCCCDLTIPYSHNGHRVNSIGFNAFRNCNSLESVVIPEGVVVIKSGAFEGCSRLKRVVMPLSVKEIWAHAFAGCAGLIEVQLPGSLEILEESAFAGCSALQEVIIPPHVKSIGKRAFVDCQALKKLSLSEGVSCIGEESFAGCAALESVSLPKGLEVVGARAFEHCLNLVEFSVHEDNCLYFDQDGVLYKRNSFFQNDGCDLVCWPCAKELVPFNKSLTAIREYAFTGCVKSMSVVIPRTVVSIDRYAFYRCTGLIAVSIPKTVAHIQTGTFTQCKNLKQVTIEEGVRNIDECTFNECPNLSFVCIPKSIYVLRLAAFEETPCLLYIPSNLQHIDTRGLSGPRFMVDSGNSFFLDVDGILYDKSLRKLVRCPKDRQCVDLPREVRCIAKNAFAGCTQLRSIKVNSGDGVCADWESFRECSAFNLVIASCVREIKGSLCGFNVSSIVISEGVQAVCDGAFFGSRAKEIEIPNSLRYISSHCCDEYYCRWLPTMAFRVGLNNRSGYFSHDGVLYQRVFVGLSGENEVVLLRCPSQKEYCEVPSFTTAIADYAFSDCEAAKKVVLHEGLKRIGAHAFSGCKSLLRIEIPRSVKTIGEMAFNGCASLASLCLHNGLESFGYGASSACCELRSIEIPGSVEEIAVDAFLDCTRLSSLKVCEGVKRICSNAFGRCRCILSIELPASAQSVAVDAFSECENLDAVHLKRSLGDGVKEEEILRQAHHIVKV